MKELLRLMILEEWRIHTSLFNRYFFMAFPLILMTASFGATFILPTISGSIVMTFFVVFIQYMFLIYGISVGNFSYKARELLERRFGETGFLFNCANTFLKIMFVWVTRLTLFKLFSKLNHLRLFKINF